MAPISLMMSRCYERGDAISEGRPLNFRRIVDRWWADLFIIFCEVDCLAANVAPWRFGGCLRLLAASIDQAIGRPSIVDGRQPSCIVACRLYIPGVWTPQRRSAPMLLKGSNAQRWLCHGVLAVW
eukprot:UN0504